MSSNAAVISCVQIESQGIVQGGPAWSRLFYSLWYKSVWRNCHWCDFIANESWYSKPLQQHMFSGLGSGLKWVALALAVGWHGVPRQRKKHCRDGNYHVLS